MEERLILLDNDDRAIGEGSKKDCQSPASACRGPPDSRSHLTLAQAT